MSIYRSIACLTLAASFGAVVAAHAQPPQAVAPPPEITRLDWTGRRAFRLVVKVAALPLQAAREDECPAELTVDFATELQKLGISQLPDLASVQVVGYSPQTGKPRESSGYAYAENPYENPFRWYDAAIPYEFPEFANDVTRTQGQIKRRPRVRGGYFFNVIGDWNSGRLCWMHRQVGTEPSWYAVYFDLLPPNTKPAQIPPRAWLGDGLPRCDKVGSTTMGADHCRVDLDDWDGDGLVDLIVGENYGHVCWLPNVGTKKQPKFTFAKFVFTDDGPLDAGVGAAPKVVDWDGDGLKDLLVGAHWNRLLFYRNIGTNQDRQFHYAGLVTVDGQPLELPIQPLTRGSSDIFRRDYYPVPEVVDWDGDGDLDLLAGGYVTGSIFFFENLGQQSDGTPQLKLQGPLLADGNRLNVGHWCAAPCVADFDGDGDWDLMSGNMPMHLQPDERDQHADTFLQYFENTSTSQTPNLSLQAFPGQGSFPRERLATPRAFDWDDDGDLDLVVSARENLYLFENDGTINKPHFATHAVPLEMPWGLAGLSARHFRDWNGDGRIDIVNAYKVRLNSGTGNPFRWTETEAVLPPGKYISHPSGIGDDWFWPFLDDFDQDGDVDVLFGDWSGHIWLHRNRTTADLRDFDLTGVRLKLRSGERIKVGPINKDLATDFNALQGARTVFTVDDFNRDGRRDLVVGDTYGIVRYFQNTGVAAAGSAEPSFAEPIEIGNLGNRGLVDATDWNEDGWPDVIAGSANGRVRVFLNNGPMANPTEAPFAEGFDPNLPPILQPRVLLADINGDGDEDLFLPSTQGSCFIERSFLKHGYAKAVLISVERAELTH